MSQGRQMLEMRDSAARDVQAGPSVSTFLASKLPIGQALLTEGVISAEQLSITLQQQQQLKFAGTPVRLGDLLVRNRFCTMEQIAELMSKDGGLIQTGSQDIPLLSPVECVRFQVIPVEVVGDDLVVKAARAVTPAERLQIVEACTADVRGVRVVLVDRHEMALHLNRQRSHDSFESSLERLRASSASAVLLRSVIEALLHGSIERRASDIYLDHKPDPDSWISYRVDSTVRRTHLLPSRLMGPIYARLKLLAGMDASNSRDAQDGRYSIEHRGRIVNFRFSTQPLVDGESMTIRVNDVASLPSIEALFPGQPVMADLLKRVSRVNGKTGGLMLITGSTGGGKSTTLYVLASSFPRDTANIITVEDPVEFVLPFTRQIQLSHAAQRRALDTERAVLRQDPDVLIFGEIRDADSARTALKFAESGHFVMATLHAKSAEASIDRLLSMLPAQERDEGALVIAATLMAVVNQALVKRLCACAQPADEVAFELGKSRRMRAVGCPRCEMTGYRGRVALHETLIINMSDAQRGELVRRASRGGKLVDLDGVPGVVRIRRLDVAQALRDAGVLDEHLCARVADMFPDQEAA